MRGRKITIALLGLLATLSAGGCASNPGSSIPVWAGGEPAGVPPPKAEAKDYPLVQESPPPRATKPISEADQARLEAELSALRNRVNSERRTPQTGEPSGPPR